MNCESLDLAGDVTAQTAIWSTRALPVFGPFFAAKLVFSKLLPPILRRLQQSHSRLELEKSSSTANGWDRCSDAAPRYLLPGACLPEAEGPSSALISSRTWRTAPALGSWGA